MATQRHYFQGKLEWAKVFEFNRDKKGPNDSWVSHGGATTITVWLDKDEQKKYKDSGIRLQYKKKYDEESDEWVTDIRDGCKAVTFKRKWLEPRFESYKSEPEVTRVDGTDWDSEEDGLIGNDSVGIVCVASYDTQTGKGHRLEGVQVLEHVEFKSEGGSGGSMFQDRSGGAKAEPKPKSAPKPKADLEDEIPF